MNSHSFNHIINNYTLLSNRLKSSTYIQVIIGILVILIIIIISYILYKRRIRDKRQPIFCRTPTLCTTVIRFLPTYITPSSGVYQFSYHFYIYVNNYDYRYGDIKEVFSKGDSEYTCPSFSLDKKVNNGIITIMTGKGLNRFILPNIDIKRWCHIAICVKNVEVDIYYKGKLYKTSILDDLCKINGEDIIIGKHNGFSGFLYNLSYSPDFLTATQINKLSKHQPPLDKLYFDTL